MSEIYINFKYSQPGDKKPVVRAVCCPDDGRMFLSDSVFDDSEPGVGYHCFVTFEHDQDKVVHGHDSTLCFTDTCGFLSCKGHRNIPLIDVEHGIQCLRNLISYCRRHQRIIGVDDDEKLSIIAGTAGFADGLQEYVEGEKQKMIERAFRLSNK